MTPRARTLVAVLFLTCSGCRFLASYRPDRKLDESQRLANFLEEVFLARLDRDPILQTRLGFDKDQDRWTDLSDEFARESHEMVQRDRARLLRDFALENLDDASRLDYLVFLATRTGARFVVSESADGRFYFNLHAKNGAIVLSSQSYSSEAAALNGTFSVAANGIDPDNFDVREASSGFGYYFNLIATNGQTVGTSEVYSSKSNAKRARDSIVVLLPNVDLL